MDWLAMEKLDPDLHLLQVRLFPGNTWLLSGLCSERHFRLNLVTQTGTHIGDIVEEITELQPSQSESYTDTGLRLVVSLDNPRPLGMRLVDRGDLFTPLRRLLHALLRSDQEGQFHSRYELEVWPERYHNHCLSLLARRDVMGALLRLPGPIEMELGINGLSLKSPRQVGPRRALRLIRAAVALADVLESVSKVDILC